MIDAVGEILEAQEKCTRQLVLNAERKQKFLLNQMAPDLFIVRIAFKNANPVDFK